MSTWVVERNGLTGLLGFTNGLGKVLETVASEKLRYMQAHFSPRNNFAKAYLQDMCDLPRSVNGDDVGPAALQWADVCAVKLAALRLLSCEKPHFGTLRAPER